MDEALTYFSYAKEFGWTPQQVDEAPALLADRMLVVAQLNNEINNEHQSAAAR